MAVLVSDCPRCGAKQMTFDVLSAVYQSTALDWVHFFEVFTSCRRCAKSTVFLLHLTDSKQSSAMRSPRSLVDYTDSLNKLFTVERPITLRDNQAERPPDHLPDQIRNGFVEAAMCLSVGCPNAAATMFRLCIDLATRPLLPDPSDTTKTQPNQKQRRDLGLRLPWLFDHDLLPGNLKELASCVKEDGNDGAHEGTLTNAEAEDLLDFTFALLDRLISEPERIKIAQGRRAKRRENR